MNTYSLAVIGGDGIGPDVTQAALAGVQAAAERYGFTVRTTSFDLGAEHYLRTGEVMDRPTTVALEKHDAVLLGAVGDPRVAPGILERGLVVALRTAFNQSVNIRPVRLYPGVESPVRGVTSQNCDLVVVRENTEGLYTGGGSLSHAGSDRAVAVQNSITTAGATAEAVEFAFQLAQQRRRRVTLCHKTNILVHAGQLWQQTVNRIAESYPEVEHDYVHADAMCQHLPLDPGRFDVIVTDNLFGDIISDLGATVQGGLGLAASANFNPRGTAPSMYEPVHGSAPDIAGKGWANPAAAALSAALCLAGLGQREAALSLEAAVASVVAELPALAGPEMGADTAALGHRIAQRVAEGEPVRDGTGEQSLMSALGRLAQRAHPMSV
ncbi:3-isopropylmalate dehydrogenase [Nesterenkonia sphaerica]|uniref:3-isopropylmalate dehydrogenase n=1 Tax=Nesterenkonia sphaerica TaxID=1804988 RepID=A0A5R9AF98_9MICC|nr:3-isopropylmalate dehydrogenase [Nesterenkonia sphaerica]TLP77452.1 3-isopropylmalate dehydrogenase [Nesterenkonia sphaerica]